MVTILLSLLNLVVESLIQKNTARINYNPESSTLQCKFEGYAHDVIWHFYSLTTVEYLFHLYIYMSEFLAVGDRYHQSTIHSASEESYYINELTITDRNASIGPYFCFVNTYSYRGSQSTFISTSKIISVS